MAAKTRTLTFNGNTITFLRWGKLWVIPAKLLGQALGYSSNGDKLANLVSTTWKKEFRFDSISSVLGVRYDAEAILLRKDALTIFKTMSTEEASKAPHMLILTMAGVIRVLGKSRAKMAVSFKNFLVKNGGELLKGHEGLQPSEGGSSKPEQLSFVDPAMRGVSSLEDLLLVFHAMDKNGLLSKKEKKEYLQKVLDIQFVRVSKDSGVTHFLTPDGKVPPTDTKALTKNAMAVPEGVFKVVTTENPQHPDYPDWLPASSIGAAFGLKGDLVKKYIKQFCESHHIDLPNNDAKKFVTSNSNIFPAPDNKGFIIFKPPHHMGLALYMQMEGNQMNWRNYWSPVAVEQIRALIAQGKGINLAPEEEKRAEILVDILTMIGMGGGLNLASAQQTFSEECKKFGVRIPDIDIVQKFLDQQSVAEEGLLKRYAGVKDTNRGSILYLPKSSSHPGSEYWEYAPTKSELTKKKIEGTNFEEIAHEQRFTRPGVNISQELTEGEIITDQTAGLPLMAVDRHS